MARLFEHVQETARLLVTHALDGHAEGVRSGVGTDNQISANALYQALFVLVPQLELHGKGFALLKKGLADKHYRTLARMVEPAGLRVSQFENVHRPTPQGRIPLLHYLHSGTREELALHLRKLDTWAPLPRATL